MIKIFKGYFYFTKVVLISVTCIMFPLQNAFLSLSNRQCFCSDSQKVVARLSHKSLASVHFLDIVDVFRPKYA